MKVQSINCGGIPFLTALRWVLSKDAKYSRCKNCLGLKNFSVRVLQVRRLSLTSHGKVWYDLKTPYRDGATHVIFETVNFIAKLAALVHKLWLYLTHYLNVFA